MCKISYIYIYIYIYIYDNCHIFTDDNCLPPESQLKHPDR